MRACVCQDFEKFNRLYLRSYSADRIEITYYPNKYS